MSISVVQYNKKKHLKGKLCFQHSSFRPGSRFEFNHNSIMFLKPLTFEFPAKKKTVIIAITNPQPITSGASTALQGTP